jgi:hypothetical protein
MAILDKVYQKLQECLSIFSTSTSNRHGTIIEYMNAMKDSVISCNIFQTGDLRKLTNVFSSAPAELDREQRADLLNIKTEGLKRMKTYIRQYMLDPPTEVRQKRLRRKLKTFTKVKNTEQ